MEKLPDPRIIPGNTPAEGARWIMQNREEAKKRVRKLREEVRTVTGQGGPTTSTPSETYSNNWEAVFGKSETKKE